MGANSNENRLAQTVRVWDWARAAYLCTYIVGLSFQREKARKRSVFLVAYMSELHNYCVHEFKKMKIGNVQLYCIFGKPIFVFFLILAENLVHFQAPSTKNFLHSHISLNLKTIVAKVVSHWRDSFNLELEKVIEWNRSLSNEKIKC